MCLFKWVPNEKSSIVCEKQQKVHTNNGSDQNLKYLDRERIMFHSEKLALNVPEQALKWYSLDKCLCGEDTPGKIATAISPWIFVLLPWKQACWNRLDYSFLLIYHRNKMAEICLFNKEKSTLTCPQSHAK